MGALVISPTRVRAAYATAVLTDVLQFAIGPVGWMLADEVLDVIAMILITRLIGFPPLLLPTFVLEIVPVADLLPTWTACVALVTILRRKQVGSAPPPTQNGPVIDV